MKRIVTGILAHVDAGKTTLSEALLYTAGEIRTLGRVDNQDAFLDTDEIERKRGITVFSKQAVFKTQNTEISLIDTPGHMDFAAEAERTLQVLDYAILVISGTDGVQSHTKNLWDLLASHKIPTFVFINKLDLEGADKNKVIDNLRAEFNENFVDFCGTEEAELFENLAVCDEKLMNEYLETGSISANSIRRSIKLRNVFPCFSGSALRMIGIEQFLKGFSEYTEQVSAFPVFGAKVFKISQDDKGKRLTFMKITGGSLSVKESVNTGEISEKVNEIRVYSGAKYKNIDVAEVGTVCAVTGLGKTYSGQGLGFESNSEKLTAEPIFNYKVILPENTDSMVAFSLLKQLEEEETQLSVSWNEQSKEINLRIMGEVQLEVLKQLIYKRFNLEVEFEEGRILYKETIKNVVEGVGHYEPLRHYAEVHLLLEPLPEGSGVQFESDCPEDELDKNWQRLIMTHLMEKEHSGVLTGSPITDIKITLKAGRAHLKHTEGGDFRQATYRAVRQGLRRAESVLLEPYYEFTLQVPTENIGRAMTDLSSFGAEFSAPETRGDFSKISGVVPAAAIQNYQRDLIEYTHGKGKLSCKFGKYGPCLNQDSIVEKIAYDCDSDIENTADSVFCSHGAGFTVKWDEVPDHMHLESILKQKSAPDVVKTSRLSTRRDISDEELLKIFEHTYGKIEQKNPNKTMRTPKDVMPVKPYKKLVKKAEKEYLLIDGYNIIFSWDELKEIAKENMEAARTSLVERISSYKAFKKFEVIVVFDAYRVKGNRGEVDNVGGISVVYTKEAQTADSYIEKTAKELSKHYRVTVATSDLLEQMIIFGSGAFRLSAKALQEDVLNVEKMVRNIIETNNLSPQNAEFLTLIREKLDELTN
ncbi:MAG: TetM/TetW/TetO/TetS family tetracycline resistance ribosomal protection protein [Clostridia bacterium]|nr:TetM/TetW/TetO/TetS family tetracycline resistance ribosomal protection protein [Clostridia bacterium]